MLIGDKLKEIRKKQRITLSELSQKSGVQLATLSRIENKKMTGTIDSHQAIAKALGIDVVELYQSIIHEQKQVEASNPKSANEVFTHNDKSSFEILTKNLLSKQMMPTLIRIEPNGSTQEEQGKANSEKFIFVIEGACEAMIDKKPILLKKNHSLYFNASLPHFFKCASNSTVKIICVATPVSL